ncbi:MAG: hypothetical protein ACYDA1_04835 [Vulcanimicrobiaceae bacterium]
MNATLERYRVRLNALATTEASSSKAGAIIATRAVLREMGQEIEALLARGEKPTAIAKALAPRGERPSWETVRRAIAEEFDIPKAERKKRGPRTSRKRLPNLDNVKPEVQKEQTSTIIGASGESTDMVALTPSPTPAITHQAQRRNADF